MQKTRQETSNGSRRRSRRTFSVVLLAILVCAVSPASAAGWDARLNGFVPFFDRDGDFVNDGEVDQGIATIAGDVGDTVALPSRTFTTPDGFVANSEGSIRTADGTSADPYDVALRYAAEFGGLRIADGIEVAPFGTLSASTTVEIDFPTFLTHTAGGFTDDTVALEITLDLTGSFVWEQEIAALPLRSGFTLTYGDPLGGFDRKGVFLTSAGASAGSLDLAAIFTLESETVGDITRTQLSADGQELTLLFDWAVPTGALEAELDTRISIGIEHSFLNLSGVAGFASGTAVANFGGESVAIRSIRALAPDIDVAFVPEPSTALTMLLGLMGLAGHRQAGATRAGSDSRRAS